MGKQATLCREDKRAMSRRRFVEVAAVACAWMVTSRKGIPAPARQVRIIIRPSVEIGIIRPELHSHFVEHLGSCIYGGLWVGRGSQIPNVDGYRKQAVEFLRELGIPVLRWPGGCFADDYHWRDGIGPADKRPKTVNLHWGRVIDDNSFGTHEFIGLCRLIGSEPYLAGNVGNGTPVEMRDWLEYCNQPAGSSLAEERASNGSREPFRVRYWGVGNENWGCGGHMTPEEYAGHYRRFATYLTTIGDTRPFLIACGPNRNDLSWSRKFMDRLLENAGSRSRVHGFAMHFYSGGKSPATKFSLEHAEEQLSSFADLERAIQQQRALLDSYDPGRRIGLMVDEWGVWDQAVREEYQRYGQLWQQNTMRSAVAAALGLNVFHRQAEKLVMCNIAQMVNVLHALLLTDGEHCIRTPSYFAYLLMKDHRGKAAVRVENPETSPLGVSVSASKQGSEIILTCVNPNPREAVSLALELEALPVRSASAKMLRHPDLNACNTFENPESIVPREHPVDIDGFRIRADLPPISILSIVVGS